MSSKLVRVSLLATVLSACGCVVLPSDRGVAPAPAASPVQQPRWATHVVEGRAPAGVERAIRESGAVGAAAVAWTASSSVAASESTTFGRDADEVAAVASSSSPLALHISVEETVDAPPALAFLAGMTALTVPAMQWHEVVVRGWIADGETRLYEAEARRQVTVAWAWWGAFAPWLWADADGEGAIDETAHAMTQGVIADLIAQHDARPPALDVVTPPSDRDAQPAPAPWNEPEAPGPAPWNADESADEPKTSLERPTMTGDTLDASSPVEEPRAVEGDSSE